MGEECSPMSLVCHTLKEMARKWVRINVQRVGRPPENTLIEVLVGIKQVCFAYTACQVLSILFQGTVRQNMNAITCFKLL